MYSDYYRDPERFMNIFYLDEDPHTAAKYHCDRHVCKMIIETAQILSTAWCLAVRDTEFSGLFVADWQKPSTDTPLSELAWLRTTLCGQRVYRPTHESHPCVQWACLYGGNYDWLWRLGMSLSDEYTFRYGKVHATTSVLRTLEVLPPPLMGTINQWCDAPAVVTAECELEDVVSSYKEYYRKSKTGILSYTKRPPPDWVADLASFKEA